MKNKNSLINNTNPTNKNNNVTNNLTSTLFGSFSLLEDPVNYK